MSHFIKINLLSILYAILFVMNMELMFNVYRISRLTGFDIAHIVNGELVMMLICTIFGSALFYLLNRRYLMKSKINYISIILWIPYAFLLMELFAAIYPITNNGDTPNRVTGLVMIGGLVIYPFYLSGLTFIANAKKQ